MKNIYNILNNGLRQTVLDHTKQIEDHKIFMESLFDRLMAQRDSQIRTRTTDLSNKKPVVKYSIIIAVISLILGNLATIGYVLSQIAHAFMSVPR